MTKYKCFECDEDNPCEFENNIRAWEDTDLSLCPNPKNNKAKWINQDKPKLPHEDLNYISNLTSEIMSKLEIVKEAVEKLEEE